jgi:hypothetical protein
VDVGWIVSDGLREIQCSWALVRHYLGDRIGQRRVLTKIQAGIPPVTNGLKVGQTWHQDWSHNPFRLIDRFVAKNRLGEVFQGCAEEKG